MFVNLHSLPEGKSMYTVYLMFQEQTSPDMYVEEVDVIAPTGATWGEVVMEGRDEIEDLYGLGGHWVAGVVDQSEAKVIFDAREAEKAGLIL